MTQSLYIGGSAAMEIGTSGKLTGSGVPEGRERLKQKPPRETGAAYIYNHDNQFTINTLAGVG